MPAPNHAVVITNVAPMRSEPYERAELVSQALLGETLCVRESHGDFVLAVTSDDYSGWIRRSRLRSVAPDECYPVTGQALVAARLLVPVFAEPTRASDRIGLLSVGSLVASCNQELRAHRLIKLPDGATGWVARVALETPATAPPRSVGRRAVRWAKVLLGVPYVWGGRSAFGIDCSGLTQLAYALSGVVAPRDAYLQAEWEGFQAVERDHLAAGDLIFFGGAHDVHGRGITHVGLALDGARMIHAAGAIGVVISEIASPPYDSLYRCARRLRR